MTPLKDRILVKKPNPTENVTGAGIILTAKSRNADDCEVILTGPNCKNVKPGDVVRKFSSVSGIPITYHGENCLLLVEDGEIEFVHKN